MVHDTAYITNRGTQALETQPDLPFAQEYPIHTQADIPINFGQPLALASLSKGRRTYYDYIVNGDHWTFGKMVDKKVRWTESNAQQYRNKGYSVVKVSDTGDILKPKPDKPQPDKPASSPHWTKAEIEKIFINYYGDDISRLDRIHIEQEERITEAKIERDRIEGRLNKAKAEHQNIWDSIGQKSDIGHIHLPFGNGNGNGNDNDNNNGNGDWCDCGFWFENITCI